LHVACFFGNDEIAALLISAGAELDARIANTLDTALHLACEGGFKPVVFQLLRFDTKTSGRNKDGNLPLDLVPSQHKTEFKGAPPVLFPRPMVHLLTHLPPPMLDLSPFPELFNLHDEVFSRDKHGQTQLHRAAATGNLAKITQFLKRGVDVNVRDHAGWSPVHEAALAGQTEILQLLVEHGGDVNARGLNNDTALHDACENGHADIVKVLLLNGADLEVVNDDGKKPLDVTDDEDIKKLVKGTPSFRLHFAFISPRYDAR